MEYKPGIKTLSDILDEDLPSTIEKLKDQGYVVTQKKRVEEQEGRKVTVKWVIKAKLNEPPPKAGRVLIDG